MGAEDSELWRTVVEVVVGLAAFVVALGALSKSPFVGRPIQWFFRRVLIEPVGGWFGGLIRSEVADLSTQVAAINKELHPNGGSSFRDEFRRHSEISSKDRADLHAQVDVNTAAIERLSEAHELGVAAFAAGSARFDLVEEKLDTLLSHDSTRDKPGLRYGNPDFEERT